MKQNFKTTMLFVLMFMGTAGYSQTKFHVNDFNLYAIKDTVSNFVYSFDTGSEDSNLFDRKNINYKLSGITLLTNASGGVKLTRKARIKHEIKELGYVNTKANVLGNEEFSNDHCIDVDLLLGTRATRKHILSFNNKSRILTKLAELPGNINDYKKLELKYNIFDDRYYTELYINGVKEKFLVDTGYSGGITLKSDKNLSKSTDSYTFLSLVAFRAEESTTHKFQNIEIKHHGITFKTGVVYQNEKYDNIIGNSFFLNFEEVIFDLKDKGIYLLNENNLFDPYREDILISPNKESGFEIVYIKSSSEYYKNGFRVGDKIALKDEDLRDALLATPCDTRLILKNWQFKNNKTPEFTKL